MKRGKLGIIGLLIFLEFFFPFGVRGRTFSCGRWIPHIYTVFKYFPLYWKGNTLKFVCLIKILGYFYGDISEPHDACDAPRKSFLFFLTVKTKKATYNQNCWWPRNQFIWRSESKGWKSISLLEMFGVVSIALEKWGERMIFQSSRTLNRNRFSRLKASSGLE